jgi:hypothetical protein
MGCNREEPPHTAHERVDVLNAVRLMCGPGGVEDTTSELHQFPFRDFCTDSDFYVYFAHMRLIEYDYWEQFESIQRLPQRRPLIHVKGVQAFFTLVIYLCFECVLRVFELLYELSELGAVIKDTTRWCCVGAPKTPETRTRRGTLMLFI